MALCRALRALAKERTKNQQLKARIAALEASPPRGSAPREEALESKDADAAAAPQKSGWGLISGLLTGDNFQRSKPAEAKPGASDGETVSQSAIMLVRCACSQESHARRVINCSPCSARIVHRAGPCLAVVARHAHLASVTQLGTNALQGRLSAHCLVDAMFHR